MPAIGKPSVHLQAYNMPVSATHKTRPSSQKCQVFSKSEEALLYLYNHSTCSLPIGPSVLTHLTKLMMTASLGYPIPVCNLQISLYASTDLGGPTALPLALWHALTVGRFELGLWPQVH